MFYQEDWILRQIQMMILVIARLVFHKETIQYELDANTPSPADGLHLALNRLIDSGKINEAEDLLFSSLDTEDPSFLLAALDFYQSLSRMSDEALAQADFSREEIQSGLLDILKRFDITLE